MSHQPLNPMIDSLQMQIIDADENCVIIKYAEDEHSWRMFPADMKVGEIINYLNYVRKVENEA